MASSLKLTVNNSTNLDMDNRRNDLHGGFPISASPANFPVRVIPKEPKKLMDIRVSNPGIPNDRMQRYDTSFVASGNFQPVQTTNPGPRNDLGKKMNSLVITNSKLTTANQNQSLSGLVFKDKISFALPPGVSWQELNASTFTDKDARRLLNYTLEMNSQMKRNKRRPKSTKSQSMLKDNKAELSKKDEVLVKPNTSKSPAKVKITPNVTLPTVTKDVKTSVKKDEVAQTNAVILTNAISSNNQKKQCINNDVKTDCSISDVVPTKLKSEKAKLNDILNLKNENYMNTVIIESLTSLNLLSPRSSYYIKPPIPFGSIKIKKKKKDAQLSEVIKEDVNLKNLIGETWQDTDDEKEESNSKQIFEKLNGMIKDLKKTSAESSNTEKVEPPPKEAETEITKTVSKKKKKKLKEKSENKENTEEADATFEKYYDDAIIEEGLKNGSLFKEIIRINQKKYEQAFISCGSDSKDIFIDGIQDRNRALEGDEVVVELYPPEKWKTLSDNAVQKSGKVVSLAKRNHPCTAVGYLKIVYSKKANLGILLCPRDSKMPRIKIQKKYIPIELRRNPKLFESTLFLGKITSWENVKFAEGIILEKIGEECDIDVESKCILYENCLDVTSFENVGLYLPPLPYKIPEDEISQRNDIRTRCIFTIDPVGAKDLDDALSCILLPNGNVEVGVHIADVTHFLPPDTPLDKYAREKATSVYLVNAVHHMLPFKLCELCSLTPNSDKLAFSLFVELDDNADIVNHRFCKTVIRSCTQLTYAHAQDVIEHGDSFDEASFPPVVNGYTAKDCAETITRLHSLASKMRKRRFKDGALKIERPKIIFNLDEKGLPFEYSLFLGQECNWLVEEFMLLANILTANRIKECFPNKAFLRFHAAPSEKNLSTVVKYLERVGIFIDMTTAGSIYRSMMQYDGSDEISCARMTVITNLLIKPMVKARYTCSSSNEDACTDLWHYALNTPFYTHFTSPIRRYADIVVHRLLASVEGYAKELLWSSEDIQDIANNCNRKNNNAKKASEMSTELYLRLYLEKCGPLRVRGVVIDVKERYFEVIDLSTRSASRIQVDKIEDAEKVEFKDDGIPSLLIKWKKKNKETEDSIQIIQCFTLVDVELSYQRCSNKFMMNKITATLLNSTY